MQIKLAISNLDPRPARLAKDWQREYQVYEALEGYKRAAAAHGWQVRSILFLAPLRLLMWVLDSCWH